MFIIFFDLLALNVQLLPDGLFDQSLLLMCWICAIGFCFQLFFQLINLIVEIEDLLFLHDFLLFKSIDFIECFLEF